jgi:hypothetical protein
VCLISTTFIGCINVCLDWASFKWVQITDTCLVTSRSRSVSCPHRSATSVSFLAHIRAITCSHPCHYQPTSVPLLAHIRTNTCEHPCHYLPTSVPLHAIRDPSYHSCHVAPSVLHLCNTCSFVPPFVPRCTIRAASVQHVLLRTICATLYRPCCICATRLYHLHAMFPATKSQLFLYRAVALVEAEVCISVRSSAFELRTDAQHSCASSIADLPVRSYCGFASFLYHCGFAL